MSHSGHVVPNNDNINYVLISKIYVLKLQYFIRELMYLPTGKYYCKCKLLYTNV